MKKWVIIICLIVCPHLAWGQNFAYPQPPDTIRDRQGRINYMEEHFWNEKTIADTTWFQSPTLLLDYLYLLRQADDRDLRIRHFLSLSCRQENTFGWILYWLDNILYDSSSPQYNEALYQELMDAVIASDADSVMKLIPRQRMEIISKNRIGSQANDFTFFDKLGIGRNLYDVQAPLLLLIFNNPDCSLCHQTEGLIVENKELQAMINSGRLKVLAITPDAEIDVWLSHAYPSNWLVGYDKEKAIYNRRLYDIQRLPCIYLLDKEKRVLLKEADYDRLLEFLSKIVT